jgi:hypothetical protein
MAWFATTFNTRAIPFAAIAGMTIYLVMLAVLKRQRSR